MNIDAQDFRNTLGRFASGVTVVTMQSDDGLDTSVRGITVSAFMSLSLEPPLVAVCIDKNANAHEPLVQSTHYGVSILNHTQSDISNHFAGRPSELDINFERVEGFPVIQDALAHLVCRIVAQHDVGDHDLFVGQIEHLRYRDADPLLYFSGRYRSLADS